MNTSINTLPLNSSENLRPLLPSDKAKKLNRLLLDLAKSDEYKTFSSDLRKTVDMIRDKFIGYNRETTKRKILKFIQEFHICEMADFLDELGIHKTEITGALVDLISEKKIIEGKRRRWNEVGEHYNFTYQLVK